MLSVLGLIPGSSGKVTVGEACFGKLPRQIPGNPILLFGLKGGAYRIQLHIE